MSKTKKRDLDFWAITMIVLSVILFICMASLILCKPITYERTMILLYGVFSLAYNFGWLKFYKYI